MTASETSPAVKALREDVLVSVCFGGLPATSACFKAVASLATTLDSHFRFREIIVIAEEGGYEAFLPLISAVDNVRLFTVRDGTNLYRKRVIAADEAIGDVVLITHVAELDTVDFVDVLEQAVERQHAILAVRTIGAGKRALASPLVALGKAAGFNVGLQSLHTLAVPRTLLNQMLGHPSPDLALRFPPRDSRVPLSFVKTPSPAPVRETGQVERRLSLLQTLLVHVAPSLLKAVTFASALLAMIGLGFAFYVLCVWIIVADLAAGWLTLSAMLSLTAFFLGISIMGLSLGLQQLLAQSARDGFEGVTLEVNQIDLFSQVVSDLNVELERARPEPVGRRRW